MQELAHLVFLPAVTSLLVVFLATPIIIKLAPRLGILDDPKKRHHPASLHKKPLPRGGGLSIFLGILIASLFFLPLDQRILGILLGATVIIVVGFLDDRRDINPYFRLLSQILAAGIIVASGIGIAFVSNPLGGIIDLSTPRISFELLGEFREIWIFSAIFGFLWIVALMNAVSWASGVDGQLSGFAIIAAGVLVILSLRFVEDQSQWPVIILASITLGAFLGFFPWHVFPQKIMPGFGGATLAGFMLAVLSILATAKVGTLLVVLAIPLADAGYAITRRVVARKSPVWGDRKHLHHRLLDSGWSKKKIAYFYWVATALLGAAALNLNAKAKFYTIVAIALVVGGILLWINKLLQLSKPQDRGSG